MADDPKPDPAKPDDKKDPDDLGDAGKKALAEERRARRDAEKKATDLEARLQELEDKDKSESEKLTTKLAAAEKRALDAESSVARLEVALDKGLSKTQARRLVGTTADELIADADDLLASFKPADDDKSQPKPPGKPTESLKGGGDPTQDPPVDIRKVVDAIPRGF